MSKEAINKTHTSKLLKNAKCIANNSYLNYFLYGYTSGKYMRK